MNCADLNWEARGARPLSAEEQAHVSGCESCRADLAVRDALLASGGGGAAPALSERILAQAHQALADEPRPQPWSRGWLGGSVAAIALASCALFFFHRRPDLEALGPLRLWLNLALFGAAFVLGGRAAFGPGLVPRGRIGAALLAGAAAICLLTCPARHAGPSGEGHWMCFGGIVAVSAIPLLLFFMMLRLRSRAWLSGACAGLAAGALGEAAFFLHCPFAGFSHLAGAHLMAWLFLAAVGAALMAAFPARIWRPKRS